MLFWLIFSAWSEIVVSLTFEFAQIVQKFPLENSALRIETLTELKNSTINFVQFKGEIKPHYHTKHDEIVVALEGEGLFTLGDQSRNFKAGSLFVIPKKTIHAASCQGEEICRAYSLFIPRWNPKKPDRIFVETQ